LASQSLKFHLIFSFGQDIHSFTWLHYLEFWQLSKIFGCTEYHLGPL